MGLVQNYQPVSTWFKAEDIENGEMILTITEIGEFTFDDGRTQPTVTFQETDKKLGLNKTNREKLAEIFGTVRNGVLDVEPHELIGQKIAAYRATTQNREGATVPCVRIRQVRNNAPAASFTAPAPAAQPAPLTNGQMRGIIDQLQGAGRDAGIDVGRPDGPGDFGTWRNQALRAIEAAKAAPAPAANAWDDEDSSDPFADS